MKTAAEIIPGNFASGWHEVVGTCPTHGEWKSIVRDGAQWQCERCFDEQLKREADQIWLEQRRKDVLAVAHLPGKFMGRRWPAATPAQVAVRGLVRQFRDFIVENKNEWAALLMTGETGTGKTWLATELAEALIRNLGMSVRYVTAQGMIGEIQACYSIEGKSESGEIERFVQYDLLLVDEADVKRDSQNAVLLLTEVINRRYLAGKPVVVLTNQALDNLEQFVGDRVFSRLHENRFVCLFDWPDFRKA